MHLIIGIIGLIAVSIGAFLEPSNKTQKHYFLWGCSLLALYSILDKSLYFSLLQLVAVSGSGCAFLKIPDDEKQQITWKWVGIMGLVALGVLLWQGQLGGALGMLGAAGLILLAAGFGSSKPPVFLAGGVVILTYSWIAYFTTHAAIGALFGVLNIVFVITSTIGTVKYYKKS